MHTPLNAEITRLYRLDGDTDSQPLELVSAAGQTRALVLEFRRKAGQAVPRHWDNLCRMANYLQQQLELPAPAVSITGVNSFRLWLSLAHAVPLEHAETFLQQLCATSLPELAADELDWLPQGSRQPAQTTLDCPPTFNGNGLWSAFIHPGMGAAFEEESGLVVEPPPAGQAAFLERLHSISASQWTHACALLQSQQPEAAPATQVAPTTQAADTAYPHGTEASATAAGTQGRHDTLLLKDATLDDIIRHLHERNIEPTFRHLLPKR